MKILFLHAEYNGVAYWRMFEPARWLNMAYKDVSVTYFPCDEGLEFAKPLSEWEELAKAHDLIVFGRVSDEQSLTTMLYMREVSKKPIVMEMDDDWSKVDKKNLAYRDWHPNSIGVKMADAQTKAADMLQVSTHPLKQAMGYRYSKKTWIAPNLVDIRRWDIVQVLRDKIKPKRDEIRIGWAGSATHYGDFLPILPAIKEIGAKYPKVKFVICGMKADYFFNKEKKIIGKGNNLGTMLACPVDPERFELHDGVNFWKWPQKVAELDLDIVIAPLEDSIFNKAKSNARYLEFSSLGVPGVYADVYPFSKTIKHGVNGFLARTTSQWVDYISQLIDSKELRIEMGEKAHENVEENYSFQNQIGLWRKNYEEILNHSEQIGFVPYYKQEDLCQAQLVGSQKMKLSPLQSSQLATAQAI